jgi:adenylosuccinate lyase
VATQIVDSALHGYLWGTDEARRVFDERQKIQSWLEIIAALAAAQAELDIIPAGASAEIAAAAQVERLDLNFVAAETRATGHSTLGLIHGLQRILPEQIGRWVYFGATVQDVTDTWTALAMKRVGGIAYRELRRIELALIGLAKTHRETVMAARTHGQPGLPLTFGYKAAVWASEVRRHIERLKEGRSRWLTGQLGGAAGTLSFWGDKGLELRRRFLERLGLAEPDISWTSARDNLAEFVHLLAMATTTLAKIGDEIYQLQRWELGELGEPFLPGRVGSITMPHKRNPELSEHLDTLARIVRSDAALLTTGIIQEHERDGRGWKTEWLIIPQACLLASASFAFAVQLIEGLQVNPRNMLRNLEASAGYVLSEAAMAELSPQLGKERAHRVVYEAAMAGIDRGVSLAEALQAEPEAAPALKVLTEGYAAYTGQAKQQSDRVVAMIQRARAEEAAEWLA